MEAAITKQGVRNLNSLGPQRKRPPRDDQPRKQPDAEASATPAAPTADPAAAPADELAAAPAPAADKT